MTKCWLLLKVQLLGFFNINRVRHSKDKKERRRLINFSVLMLFVVIIMVGYSTGMAVACAYFGMADFLPALILMVVAACTLIVTFMKSSGVLFGFRDYDTVMSLPVTSRAVIVSRLISIYAMNFLVSCVIMLPSVIVYGITAAAPASVWFMLVSSLFLAPMLPMIVSVIAGTVITAVSARFRYKNIIVIILSIAAILALFAGSFALPQEEGALKSIITSAAQTIFRIYPMARLYTDALANNDWGCFGLFALLSVGAIFLFVMLLSAFYTKINSALFAVRKKSGYRLEALKASTPFLALYRKELRRLLSSPIYVMNTCIGAILLIVASVAFMFVSLEQIGIVLELPDIAAWITPSVPWIAALFVVMSTTTTSSMSLEGKSRWLMCSAPVPANMVYNAKIAVSLTYLVPSVMLGSALLTIRFKPGFFGAFALFAIPLLFSVFISVVGLALNLQYPKYDWTSETQAVKQSISVLATLGVGFGSVIMFFVLSVSFQGITVWIQTLAMIIVGAVTLVIYNRISKKEIFM